MPSPRLSPAGWTGRLAAIGHAPGDDADARLRKATLTLASASITILASAWTLVYLALGRPASAAIPLAYQLASILSLVVLARTKRDDVFRISQVGLMVCLPVLLQWSLGGFVNGSAVMIWAFVAPLGALVFMTLRQAIATFGAFVGLTVLSGLLDPRLAAGAAPLASDIVLFLFVLNVLGVSAVVFLVLAYFVRERQRALDDLDRAHRSLQAEQAELQAEQERSAGLLRNILPDTIADRLKGGDRLIADRHPAVTVLFADIVGFTPLAARLGAGDLVLLLDRVFGELEALCERFGLEKIKTAGDSFMAVAGLEEPGAVETGAGAAADMALAIFPALERANKDLAERIPGLEALSVRVGLHTGPVVAGIIGRRKFAYDLWGDAVNVASRMESHGLPGRIQTSPATYELLRRRYRFRYRGAIEVKGRGEMGVYLLLGRRTADLSGQA